MKGYHENTQEDVNFHDTHPYFSYLKKVSGICSMITRIPH